MGKERTTQETTSAQTQRATATPQEKRLNELSLERVEAGQPGQLQAITQGNQLVNQLLAGGQLPGYLSQLTQGISPAAIGNQAAQLAQQNMPGFQSAGILDSGVAFKETAKDIANNLLFPTEQFNIGNIQNLLNMAMGGQAQVQAAGTAAGSALGGQLAGLRNITSSGQQFTTQLGMNPFTKAFQTGLGSSMGTSIGKTGTGGRSLQIGGYGIGGT